MLQNDKLQLALEVYAGSFFESGRNSRFLQLVTVLETLTKRKKVPEETKNAVNELLETLKRHQERSGTVPSVREQLKKLRSRLGALKKETIADSLRAVVHAAVAAYPALGLEEEVTEKIKEYYDIRSKMLHEGKFNPDEVSSANNWLAGFVPNLLRGIFFGEIPMSA